MNGPWNAHGLGSVRADSAGRTAFPTPFSSAERQNTHLFRPCSKQILPLIDFSPRLAPPIGVWPGGRRADRFPPPSRRVRLEAAPPDAQLLFPQPGVVRDCPRRTTGWQRASPGWHPGQPSGRALAGCKFVFFGTNRLFPQHLLAVNPESAHGEINHFPPRRPNILRASSRKSLSHSMDNTLSFPSSPCFYLLDLHPANRISKPILSLSIAPGHAALFGDTVLHSPISDAS